MSRKQKGKSTGTRQRSTVAPAVKETTVKPDQPAGEAAAVKAAAQDQRRRIKRLHEITAADDIRYRGPLS